MKRKVLALLIVIGLICGNAFAVTRYESDEKVTDSAVIYGKEVTTGTITPFTVTGTGGLATGGIAESTVPTAVADGASIGTWFDTYGKQLIYGANQAVGAVDVNLVNPPPVADGCNHLLDVTVNANGESFNNTMFIGEADKLAVLVWNNETASADNSQVDVTIELSPDGTALMDAETTMINSEDSAVAAAGDWTFDTDEERYFWFPAGAGITAKELKATVTCDANCDGSDYHVFDLWVCTNE